MAILHESFKPKYRYHALVNNDGTVEIRPRDPNDLSVMIQEGAAHLNARGRRGRIHVVDLHEGQSYTDAGTGDIFVHKHDPQGYAADERVVTP